MCMNKEIRAKIVDLIQKLGINQSELSRRLGVSRECVSQIVKTGKFSFRISTIFKVGFALDQHILKITMKDRGIQDV